MSEQAQVIQDIQQFYEPQSINLKPKRILSEDYTSQKVEYIQSSEQKPTLPTKPIDQIKEYEIKPSEIDLENSKEMIDDNYFEQRRLSSEPELQDQFAMSVHMQSQQFKVNYHKQPQSQFSYPTFQNNQNAQNKTDNIKLNDLEQSLPFLKKSVSSDILNSQLEIPKAADFNHLHKQASQRNSVSSFTERKVEYVQRFEILKNTKQIIFYKNDQVGYKKLITEAYLDYLEKYFLTFFNILIPTHVPQIFTNLQGISTYLQIYFEFIVSKYSAKLLEFLEKSHFKQTEISESQNMLQSRIVSYKNLIVSTLYSGLDVVESTFRKFKGQTTTNTRLLERVFTKQMQMAQKHHKSRMRIQSVAGQGVHPSPYQNKQSQTREYILMALRWIVGFQITIEKIEEKQAKADPVQKQKLQILLNEFLLLKKQQQAHKMKILQDKIHHIYKQ